MMTGGSEVAHQQATDSLVQEGRRKYSSHLEDHVLDYLHNNPVNIEACLNTCIKIFGNIVNNPHEEKYRKVKASSHTLKGTVFNVKGGEDLLLCAGWSPKVIELEKYWIFDAAPDSVRFGVLREALHLTEKALRTVHEKAEKKFHEHQEKLTRESAEKQRVRLAIEADRAERKERAEFAAAAAAAAPRAVPHAASPAKTQQTASQHASPAKTPAGGPKGGSP